MPGDVFVTLDYEVLHHRASFVRKSFDEWGQRYENRRKQGAQGLGQYTEKETHVQQKRRQIFWRKDDWRNYLCRNESQASQMKCWNPGRLKFNEVFNVPSNLYLSGVKCVSPINSIKTANEPRANCWTVSSDRALKLLSRFTKTPWSRGFK